MEELEEVIREASVCKKCKLSESRTNVVFGEGSTKAKTFLIGEAPGFNEDKEGKPFVGQAGKILNETLLKIAGFERSEVYITNVVKCRPPNNREPTQEEIEACFPYLDFQIKFVKPKLIVTLGNVATSTIFSRFNLKPKPISQIHGQSFSINSLLYGSLRIVPTYHPATALYNPKVSEIMKKDWKMIGEILRSIK
ncbi:MAG: uracil-DNA glycosylase [Thermoproteota archaeon]|nr:uracil-DNA glycosylase [Candidatus Brockarchaeota archaeon]MBO3763312.1 uracil-DNA glycosylase [Candidatus Brockarchaeota archaeon]MBO3768072.1 uracil-DNA glycosylase [Candidatus Brockarchaeota archaeon]MBO3801573.1 uracil-DNA glycosylase [Candidatus Brockarchaeota archaeon]